MELKTRSDGVVGGVNKSTLNTECAFLFWGGVKVRTNPDSRLFWFETFVLYFCNRFWLVEECVFWNGDRQIMEMVEIKENLDDYIQETQ